MPHGPRGSPPLTRGIFVEGVQVPVVEGLTPAYAGNITGRLNTSGLRKAHPRLCGEYRMKMKKFTAEEGSPPLIRGISRVHSVDNVLIRLTPAYAGNIFTREFPEYQLEAHPRIRGEYPTDSSRISNLGGSPPLTRGI